MLTLDTAPAGTAHPLARCQWCGNPLVANQVENHRAWTCAEKPCLLRTLAWVVTVRYTKSQRAALGLDANRESWVWDVPLPTQIPLYELGLTGGNILLGGMKGSTKSHAVRRWLYHRALTIPGHESLLLRENWDQLLDNHTSKMSRDVPLLGGRWYADPPRAVFGTGSEESTITCGHMATADSVLRYQGGNKGAIACDEGGLYPTSSDGVSVLAELRTMARAVHTDRSGRQVYPVFVVATNPQGPSVPWLREMFVDHQPNYDLFPRLRGEYDPARWHYVPASLETNPYLDVEEYRRQNLSGLSEVKYRQLALGDFYAVAGAFFPEWDRAVHVARSVWA